MKTVSTKLTKEDFEKFQEICNHDGKCISEGLRDLLKMDIEAYEEGLEMEQEESPSLTATNQEVKPISEARITRISHDDGKTWIDIPELKNVRVISN